MGLQGGQKAEALKSILFSLKTEIDREMKEKKLERSIIDTSPFFSGATQLAWNASQALIIPVRTDQQSISSLELLINMLVDKQSEFRKYLPDEEQPIPKIHMVVLTHCGWSTTEGARNEPNQQTKIYIEKVYDIISKRKNLLTTTNPDNHLFMLDDFLGSGRISSIVSKPIELLVPGDNMRIGGVKVSVNKSVDKCKHQLQYISRQLW